MEMNQNQFSNSRSQIQNILQSIEALAKPSVCFFVGATASGKTSYAHEVFLQLQKIGRKCKVVNTDASQVYEKVNIGTAKPSVSEQEQFEYQNLNTVALQDRMDAHTFAMQTQSLIHKNTAQNYTSICVGGSGLYLNTILGSLTLSAERNDSIRQYLRLQAHLFGWPELHNLLEEWNAPRAAQLHKNDKTRIERALEICYLSANERTETTEMRNDFKTVSKNSQLFPDSFLVHVEKNETELKERIRLRVNSMFEMGWMNEVEEILKAYGKTCLSFQSFQAIGYKEIASYLMEEKMTSFENLKQKITTLTWQYAKRQINWNRKLKPDFWLE
jgi:tRNA dimethylallyltransferase